MTIQPEGEALRKATRWILEEHAENPALRLAQLVASACFKFDLSPQEAEFLSRWIRQRSAASPATPGVPERTDEPKP